MTTTTRTPEEIYEEISAVQFGEFPTGASLAEKLATAEADLAEYRRRHALWQELERAVPLDAPRWTWAAASAAVTAGMEKVFQAEDRVERYRALVGKSRDLPLKEEK